MQILLTQLLEHSDAEKIHLIAHSMGNRVLTRAVKEMEGKAIFNEVVLAAPDMDVDAFEYIVPKMAERVDRVTLYASSRDKALVVSNVLQGEYLRAGESEVHPVVIKHEESIHVESIDVSDVTRGHSYIADDGLILDDLKNILKESRLLNETIAKRKINDEGEEYWVLCQPCR